MLRFLVRHIKWIIVAMGVLIFVLTQTDWLTTSDIWQKTDGLTIDRQYRARGLKPPNPNIVLVGVEGSSMTLDTLGPDEINASEPLQLMQNPWPWNRKVYAAVLDKLMSAGAKVVMFDLVFAGATDGDDDFRAMLEKYQDHVLIGSMFRRESGEETEKYIPPNNSLTSGTDKIVGLVNLWPDADGIVRSANYRTSVYREFERVFKKNRLTNAPDNLIHITLKSVQRFGDNVKAPAAGELTYVDFQGPKGMYPVLPIEQMFVPELWKGKAFGSGNVFSNKIVIVGPIAEIFHDIEETPFGDTPGPEIQAQLIGALLNNSFIKASRPITDILLEIAMVALALAICFFIGNAFLKVLLLVIATGTFVVTSQMLFTHESLLLTMTAPLFCLLATGGFGILFQYALEQFERRRTKNVLERYVSKNVAKTILDDKRSFEKALSGRKQPVTILFSDIRGFTSMTEAVEPDKLVAQLNEYFLEMVGIVLKEDGTLQKFIGDAIMAAWGDTHSEGLAEDARRAVNAALQMRPALKKLNETWKDNPDRKPLATGIGVNQGEVIVGNIGHPQRMEFTVLGDGVNLAARLESATKQFHADILIGETVEKLTRDHFIFRTVDLLTVKGKTKPVEVFTLLSDKSQPPPPWLAPYQEAIKQYRGRQFTQAIESFKSVLEALGGKDFLCEMYIERCSEYELVPPPENWNGAFILTEK